MFNFALYKQGIKSNLIVFLIFLAILTMYITIIIGMYSPEQADALTEFYKAMPELMNAVGMSGDITTLLGFMITYLYGFLFALFPMILAVIIANRLIAHHTDRGSMAYLLSSPNSRFKIIFTQMKVLGTFMFILIAYITILSIVFCQASFPGELEIGKFIMLNVGLLALHLGISGIAFLASTIFNQTKYALMFGAGIPLTFFLMQMLVNMGDKLENIKYFTMLTLFDPRGITDGNNTSYIMIGILFIIAIILYSVSFKIFTKKDLPV